MEEDSLRHSMEILIDAYFNFRKPTRDRLVILLVGILCLFKEDKR